MEDIKVRLANENDIDSVLQITHQAFVSYIKHANLKDISALHETKEDIKNELKIKFIFIAENDSNEVVGSVRIDINGENAYLSRFGVIQHVRNSGIGKKLMEAVDNLMIDKGVKLLSLHTGSKVTSLIRFYYGRGFYIDSTDKSKGYIRALLCKEY